MAANSYKVCIISDHHEKYFKSKKELTDFAEKYNIELTSYYREDAEGFKNAIREFIASEKKPDLVVGYFSHKGMYSHRMPEIISEISSLVQGNDIPWLNHVMSSNSSKSSKGNGKDHDIEYLINNIKKNLKIWN